MLRLVRASTRSVSETAENVQLIRRYFYRKIMVLSCRIFVKKITSDRASVNRFSSRNYLLPSGQNVHTFLDNQELARFDM